jgi:hypothetical protein
MKNAWNYLIVVMAVMAWSCTRSDHGPTAEDVLLDTAIVNFNLPLRVTATVTSDSTALLAFSMNGKDYSIDTLIAPTSLGNLGILDFDRDGSSDILLDYIGNNPTYFLYLYDSSRRAFRAIDRYMNFPDGQHVDGDPDVYYSYSRAGCADMNWESDLFEIKDFEITHLGHLYGAGCESDSQKISIYRVVGNKSDNTVLVETLPFSSEENSNKWDIVKLYWNRNYAKFRQ